MAPSGRLGILANPLAGKDVRRLLTWAPAAPLAALGQLLRRVFHAAAAAGAGQALVMPDPYHIGEQALEGLSRLPMSVEILDMPVTGTPLDTRAAVQALAAAGAGAVLVLGGDGTNRVVAGAGADLPLLPVAHGTNNVFPWKVEAAVAGFAGGLYVRHRYPGCGRRAKLWRIYRRGEPADLALVDVALCDHHWTGSRALWEPQAIRELFLAFAGPAEVGLASLAGALCPTDRHAPCGVRVRLAAPGEPVRCHVPAHLLPGQFFTMPVAAWEPVLPGVRLPLRGRGMLALDGERTVWCDGDGWEIELTLDGPLVLDPHAILSAWSRTEFAAPEEAEV